MHSPAGFVAPGQPRCASLQPKLRQRREAGTGQKGAGEEIIGKLATERTVPLGTTTLTALD